MTKEEEQVVTFLFIKHGGFQEVVDIWLYSNDEFSAEELEAVNAWLADEQTRKPYNIKRVENPEYPFLVAEITLNPAEKD